MNPTSGNPRDSLFTDFTYYATGIPRNRAIPRNADPTFFDLGLCGPERTAPALPPAGQPSPAADSLCGKFRMPSLRNVAERTHFMHNGFFTDLRDVVRFYATRDSHRERWYGPGGVPNDLPERYRANLETGKAPFNRPVGSAPVLSESEVLDIVAFLRTLSDRTALAAAPGPVPPDAP
jgi:cytochrome c peroxidase